MTPGRPEDDARPKSHVSFALALFVLAFLLRFLAARWLAGEPVWDGHYYDFGAHRIAEGHGYSDDRIVDGRVEWHPWCHYPVGYSAYLAGFYVVFGAKPWVAHFANALAGALVAVVVFLLGHETFEAPARGPFGRAHLAGLLTAIHPGLVLYGALVMGEVVAALGVMTGFWVAIAVSRRSGWLRGVGLGAAVIGVSALVRPQALLCIPFLAFVPPGSAGGWFFRLRVAVVASVVAVVPVLPWTARNCSVMDGCALVSTNAGWNLAIGSFPRATGRFETLRSSDGCKEVTGQVQQDRCWFSYGVASIRERPGRWLGLVPAKLANTFDHESFAIEYLREARPDAWPEPRRVAWRGALTAIHRLFVIVAPFAFVRLVYRRGPRRPLVHQGLALVALVLLVVACASADTPTFWPIVLAASVLPWLPLAGRPPPSPALLLVVGLLGTTALTHAVFFGDDRYHIVATPALCLLAAAALRSTGRPVPGNTRGADTGGARAAGTSSSYAGGSSAAL